GVAYGCHAHDGMHVNEDHFIIEVLDPETQQPVPDGVQGEIVFSCITKEAFPILRYRTRDIGSITHEKCSCGRTFVRMSKPCGRTDDMLIIRGVNVFPSQIETVLIKMGYLPNYQIVLDTKDNLDTLSVKVEMGEQHFDDVVKEIKRRESELAGELKSLLGVSAKVILCAPGSIARSEGKAVRVIDNRKK
ncbi:MAG: phenylacetate--CoA ligase, partial [Clostridia bacterium]|nr:phenylacetate--CoA ligase [Clostridia bacterium]